MCEYSDNAVTTERGEEEAIHNRCEANKRLRAERCTRFSHLLPIPFFLSRSIFAIIAGVQRRGKKEEQVGVFVVKMVNNKGGNGGAR